MEFIKAHYLDLIILLIVLLLVVFAIIKINKRKGKCAYCDHADTCPFKNVDVKK